MLVVTIEIFPGGFETSRRTIATLRIANESYLDDISNYRVVAMQSANPVTGQPPGIAEFRVMGHDRRQAVWALLQRACEDAITADWVDL
ncbi:hypothetical protein [Bradyrhizobium sp. WSM471]|uniref:hypothetical protein n=1 Tax=Bradyrhizobium sp. WSM471 TaxID=319017 RepID=UPI00024D2AA7|nr:MULTISPECIES: hypothetical protein [Bradyrhizobium]EHR03032.1 hypothetical protein Bra471DRAFT_03798 [Bradyrhizobium sp. WSM471]UFW38275.1 hypothetical protein BcanWSM471_18645 [Bradyrhizobium canariense]